MFILMIGVGSLHLRLPSNLSLQNSFAQSVLLVTGDTDKIMYMVICISIVNRLLLPSRLFSSSRLQLLLRTWNQPCAFSRYSLA